ncbi:hypothetical protein Areg01_14130 [Actinoplanes regularis]|nr:hypothetical protein Areg01_14130 [Actinoplanes regularis]
MAEMYRGAHTAGTVAAAENERGEMLRRAGRPGEAAGHFARALEALGTVDEPDPGTHSAILNNLALTAHQQGDLAGARRCLVRSLEVGPLVGDPVGRAITYDNLAVIEVELARRARTDRHLNEAEQYFAAAERLFRRVLPEAIDDYLRSVLNRVDAAQMRGDRARMDRLTRHATEVAAHHGVAPENALEAVTMRGDFLHRHRDHPRSTVALMTDRLPALLPECPPEQTAAALAVLLRAATATGDPVLVADVSARIDELDVRPGRHHLVLLTPGERGA